MTEPQLNIESMKDENGLYPADIASMLSTADPEELRLLKRVGRMTIEHSRYEEAMEWLNDVYNLGGSKDDPTVHEGIAGLMFGVSGAGKSTILRHFVKEKGGPFETPEGVRRPVIRVSTPANPNLVNIQQAMLIALDCEGLMSTDASDMRLAVQRQLKEQDVRMIVFDEFTHIVEDRSEKFAVKTMRGLKEILNESTYRIVMAGTEELVKVHKLYGQMKRRSGGDLRLRAFDWEDEDDRDEWLEIMDTIQEHMFLKVEPELGSDDMARNMHQATGGIMDNIMKLVFRATSFAHRDSAEFVGKGHLAQAFERLRRGDDESVNPFGKPPVRRRKPKAVDNVEEEDETTNLSKRKNKRDDDDSFEKS